MCSTRIEQDIETQNLITITSKTNTVEDVYAGPKDALYDDCFDNFDFDCLDKERSENYRSLNKPRLKDERLPEDIVKLVKGKFGKRLSKDVTYYEGDGDFYIFNLDKAILRRVNSRKLEKYLRMESVKYRMAKCIRIKETKIFVCSDKKLWEAEILDFMKPFSGVVKDTFTSINNFADSMKRMASKVNSFEARMLVLDLLTLILTCREGYFSFGTVVITVLNIYSISKRAEAVFNSQVLEIGLNDLALLVSIFGLPSGLLESIKQFNLLSGKRFTDCNALMSVMIKFFGMILDLIYWLEANYVCVPYVQIVCDSIKNILGYFISQKLIKQVSNLYSKYVKNSQILLDATFRQEVLRLHVECNESEAFRRFVSNESNRYTRETWNAFENNVVKYAKNYAKSARSEPLCIVLEGVPGCGKSVLMNNLVEILRIHRNKSVYVHTVPPIEAGKDFYDDYENQDVFVLDDIGQKGKSEWSFVINSVSPVMYPLQCAAAEKKNTKFFNSSIILGTTNCFKDMQGFTKTDCIAEPEALFRRVHVVDVSRSNTSDFRQDIRYYKYDFIGNKTWVNKFIDINANISLPPSLDKSKPSDTLIWLLSLIESLEYNRNNNEAFVALQADELKSISNRSQVCVNDEVYEDAEAQGIIEDLLEKVVVANEYVVDFVGIMSEWMQWVLVNIRDSISSFIKSALDNPIPCMIASVMVINCFIFIKSYCFGKLVIEDVQPLEGWRRAFKQAKDNRQKLWVSFSPQGVSEEFSAQVNNVSKHSRLLQICDDSDKSRLGHILVSGNYFLAPNHYNLHHKLVNVYQSWEHFENEHVELEQVRVVAVKKYPLVDLAVYKFESTMPLYKKCNVLFSKSDNKISFEHYAVACNNICPLPTGVAILKNDVPVSYETNGDTITHHKETGWFTPLSGKGLCGTVLVSSCGSVEAMHVAGMGAVGYMVVPPLFVKEEIKKLMSLGPECEYDIDTNIIPNFSGARLRYDAGEIDKKYPVGKTNLRPTKFHVDYNRDMAELCESMNVEMKGPPIIDKPIEVLENMSKKTFVKQGKVSVEELQFVQDYLVDLIPEFADTDWETAVFGGEKIAKLNKDSSNGYGCEKDKEDYFDYDNKIILPKGQSLLSEFESKCANDEITIKDILCVEVFKDELRLEHKRKNPRTFRVMRLPHILWMKRIFANLLADIRKGMHKHGMCIGFNPYLDFDVVARKIKKCEVKCDADFAKWDGSLNAEIMRTIHDVFRIKYRGKYKHVMDVLMVSTYNSTVLVYDAIFRTTHGLPSGTWLTLFLNCLYNKCITAITLHRQGCRKISDMYQIVDYVTGDDKICGSSKEYKDKFNALTIKETSERLGMTCTNGDKTPITAGSRSFEDLDYLKRKFVFNHILRRYVGALSLNTILNTLQWFDKTSDLDEALAGKCRSMQIEAWLHGPNVYNALVRLIETTAPEVALFDEHEILEILNAPDGYRQVCLMSGKDISWSV